jgi:hypothetical protein
MCFSPSTPKDNSADLARQREEERQARITEGRGKIDEAFAQFDDPWYGTVEKNYLDYYNPEIDRQYADARRRMTLQLASRGNLSSGSGARSLGDLLRAFPESKATIANRAIDARNEARTNVENTRNELYNQNSQAADPAAIAVQAASRAGGIQPTQAYSPLGDLFGGLLQSMATTYASNTQMGDASLQRSLFGSSTPKGSSRVVN